MPQARLAKLRIERDLTQMDVAKTLGITRAFYGMIETGDRNPSLKLAQKIADFFGLSIEEIFFAGQRHEEWQGQVSNNGKPA